MHPTPLFHFPFRPTPEDGLAFPHRPKKRKFEQHEELPDTDESEESHRNPAVNAGPKSLPAYLSRQYRGVGLDPYTEEIPRDFTPHRAGNARSQPLTPNGIQKELSQLKLPLFTPLLQNSERPQTSLRQRHISALTAILHRSMLRGDYSRAERAWAMLLRVEVSGKQLDLRSTGLWGLGAELLLRRGSRLVAEHERARRAEFSPDDESADPLFDRGEDNHDEHGYFETDVGGNGSNYLTDEGVEKAKEYYDRLILYFPYRKWLPRSMSALHLYPVSFTLRIALLHEKQRNALQRQMQNSLSENIHDLNESEEIQSYNNESSGKDHIRKWILPKAEEIARDMDEQLQTPPYSDDSTLLRLRGMVALWIGDLSVITREDQYDTQAGHEDENESNQSLGSDAGMNSEDDEEQTRMQRMLKESAYATSLQARQAQVELANKFFEKAGRHLSGVIVEGPRRLGSENSGSTSP